MNKLNLPRFYPVLDTGALARRGIALLPAAAAMLDAGVEILQLRHKQHYTRADFAAAEQLAALCRAAGALLVIDDRADIARLLDAALHLGQDDLPPQCARVVTGEAAIIGFSTHNEQQMRDAAGQRADYLALGPVFGTASKDNPDPVVGTAELRRLKPLAMRPLVAIGGITQANAAEVLEAGADSVAVIGDLFRDVADPKALGERTKQWLRLTSR